MAVPQKWQLDRLLLHVGKVVEAAGDSVPAAVLLAKPQVFPPSLEVASNAQPHPTLAMGTKIADVPAGSNINVIVYESLRCRSEYPTSSSWAGLSFVGLLVS
jgi:hypothetical protein